MGIKLNKHNFLKNPNEIEKEIEKERSDNNHLTDDCMEYIALWIIDEVEEYGGTTVFDLGCESTKTPLKSLNDYTEETLQKAIKMALEAYQGGAR